MKLFAIGDTPKRRRRPSTQKNIIEFLEEYENFAEYMREKRKMEDTEKKMKTPEPRRYNLLETVGILFMLGPWIGVGTLYGIRIAVNYMEAALR